MRWSSIRPGRSSKRCCRGAEVNLDFTSPLLTALAVVNVVLIAISAPRSAQLSVGGGVVLLSGLLLKDWVLGLVYLVQMP